jgi:hypothetical protein
MIYGPFITIPVLNKELSHPAIQIDSPLMQTTSSYKWVLWQKHWTFIAQGSSLCVHNSFSYVIGYMMNYKDFSSVFQALLSLRLPNKVCYQVDDPYSVAFLTKTPIFEWYVVWCGSKNGYQKHMCPRFYNHSKLNSQLNWGDLHDQVMSTRIVILIVSKIFVRTPKIMRKVAIVSIWIC